MSGKATDGEFNLRANPWSYDQVLWKADGTAYLQYELQHAELLDNISFYLWDGNEATPRTYSYAVHVSEDGDNWSEVVPATTGARSWVDHSFAPRRVRYVRVVALGNSANAYFHICEIESHVLKLVDRTVCTDSTGKFTAYADSSGNPAYITRDAFGRIVRIADGTEVASGGALVRDLSLVWDATGLARLDYRGISSAGVQGDQPSVVRFVRAPGEYRIVRSVEASDVPVAVYLYDENDRIAGARDADGVGFLVSYDEIGRVASVTRSGAPTETVTTYAYGADQVTIATSAGGAEAPSRVVTWDPAIGGQPTSVTLEGPGAPSQTTSISYDEYGQVWKVADPLGRVSRTERDGRGNVCVAAEHESASGPVLRYTRAVYDDDDRVVRAFDVDGNESSFAYDTAGRLVSNLTVVAGSSVQGSTAAQSAYDEWGNHVASVSGDSTAHNLIRNGTFELDPLYPGNGWDGPSQGLTSMNWQTTTKPYMGAHSLVLGNYDVAPYITSDAIALKPETQYSLSASMDGWGEVHLLQYNTSGVLLDDTPVLYSAAGMGAVGMRRVSATVTTRADAVTGRVRIQRPCDGYITIDNVRLELADTASLDSIVENQSMERSAYGGVPQAWHRRLASVTTAVHEQSSDERVSGTYSAHIKHDAASADGYFVSDWMYVRPAEQYTVSVSIKTEASVGGADIAAEFYNAAGAIVPNSLVTAGFTKGTSDWRRHARTLTVPATGVKMRLFVRHKAGGGSAYFDAVSVTPGDQSVLTGFDTLTHTHAVSATGPSGVAVTAAHDARGHSTSTGVIPRGQSEVTLLERTYDDLDRLGSVTVAPASSLGIIAGFSYTDAGRLTEVTDPLERTRTMGYDAAGRLTRTTSAAGVENEFVYDPLGRLVRTLAPSQGAEPTVTATSVAYDGLGRVAQTTYHDAMGVPYATVVPTYDLASRVASTTISGAITGSTELIYDALGRVERLVSTGPAGLTQTDVTYNLADQPTQVTRSAFDVVHTQTNTYSKTHELRTLSAAGLTWRVSSDARGLTQLASERALQTRSFDTAGRLAALRAGMRWSDSSSYSDLFESRLTYDTRDRIAGVELGSMWLYDYADTYTYDPAGRLATWGRTGAGA
ncbi:MAG: discoidin domain-containing protein, partial [Aeromicrobium sp.]|nr:discoidin domain-containing protein [Aeromicrobium sp.]